MYHLLIQLDFLLIWRLVWLYCGGCWFSQELSSLGLPKWISFGRGVRSITLPDGASEGPSKALGTGILASQFTRSWPWWKVTPHASVQSWTASSWHHTFIQLVLCLKHLNLAIIKLNLWLSYWLHDLILRLSIWLLSLMSFRLRHIVGLSCWWVQISLASVINEATIKGTTTSIFSQPLTKRIGTHWATE